MQIKNEYVEIKIGNKTYRHQNMILDEYLKRMFNMQMDIDHINCSIIACCIKLDTPLDVDYDSTISADLFDISVYSAQIGESEFKRISERNNNSIKLTHIFDHNLIYKVGDEYLDASEVSKRFANKRIMGIGFSNGPSGNILAYLDTRNMNIVINYNEEIVITRVDTIQSDGECSGLDYPLHLVNDSASKDEEYVYPDEYTVFTYNTKAQLYSVGFGNVKGQMEEEYLIENVLIDRDDTSITLDLSRTKKVGYYPSESLSLNFTPIKDNSKYLIFKYRLYKVRVEDTSDYTYLDKYYTMSVLNENFGNLTIKLKVERL